MPYTHSKAHRDTNHGEIVNALKSLYCGVQDLSMVGNGCPDILVRCNTTGVVALFEIKYGKGKLNEKQIIWRNENPVLAIMTHTIRSIDEALKILKIETD